MSRASKDIGYVALRIEGGILPAEFLAKVAAYAAPKQAAADYGLPKGLTVKDEIGRAWRIALGNWRDYRDRRQREDIDKRKTGIDDWLLLLLRQVLGYNDVEATGRVHIGERGFPVTHRFAGGAVPLVAATFEFELDKGDPAFGDEGRRRSPHNALQEYLNAEDAALWGLVGNGSTLRLLRDNPSLTRPAYVEADLERMFEEQLYADFAAFWLIFHASRLAPADDRPETCILESWREVAQETGERALENLREGVTTALRELGCGFLEHPDNNPLRAALDDGSLTTDRYFQELLRLVYRLLFLFTVEDRNLLHGPDADKPVRDLYRDGYSLSLLRERARRRRHYDDHADLWAGLQVTFRSLVRGAAPLGLPALGGLFDPDQCPRLDNGAIANRRLLKAVHALCFFSSGKSLVRINYRDMDTEELGSVYESLLELHPRLDVDISPWRFGFVGDDNGEKAKGSERKLSGSYYTPDSLVQELIKSALEPVMERAIRDRPENPRQALLDLRIIDPACGSGHFLLAAARRMAAEIARLEAGEDTADEAARQHALREVVQHCIYGVDRNPLSVELCKTALWIETVEPGKPLTFLDSHIRCGDSLVGVFDLDVLDKGIPDDAYKALTGDEKDAAKHYRKLNATVLKEREKRDRRQEAFDLEAEPGELADAYARLDAMPEEGTADIDAKRKAYEALHGRDGQGWHLKIACDLWTAAFFAPKTDIPSRGRETVPTSDAIWRYLRQPNAAYGPLIAEVDRIAYDNRFLHWPVEFPDVFGKGGFDVVLGNPPWERIKVIDVEFLAERLPDLVNIQNSKKRKAKVQEIFSSSDPAYIRISKEFDRRKRSSECAGNFIRGCGSFVRTAHGDLNYYPLFGELMTSLRNENGRAGIVVKTGLLTDDGNKRFCQFLVDKDLIRRVTSFAEIRRIFPGAKSPDPFCLVTLGSGSDDPAYAFGIWDVRDMADERRYYTLSNESVEKINPNTKTLPVLNSKYDAEIVGKIYSNSAILISENDKIEEIFFPFRMYDMTNDSDLFIDHEEHNSELDAPLLEAKMVHIYDHHWAHYDPFTKNFENSDINEKGGSTIARYYISKKDFEIELSNKRVGVHGYIICWRNNARVVAQRTFIPSLIPIFPCGNSLTLLDTSLGPYELLCVYGNLASLVMDYVARQKIGGPNLNMFIVKQLPALPVSQYDKTCIEFIVPRVFELSYTANDLRLLARDLEYDGPPFAWDPERRSLLRAELDAYYAYLYGLTRDELRYILDPADVYGPDYPSETFRVLKNNEFRQFGEYRTRRLVLEAWDRFDEDGTFAPERVPHVEQPVPVPLVAQLAGLPDNAWAAPPGVSPANLALFALIDVLRRMPGPVEPERIRFAAFLARKPTLGLAFIEDDRRADWMRVVGAEARPLPTNVIPMDQFRPDAEDRAWAEAIQQLKGTGALVEDARSGQWSAGPALLPSSGQPWMEGRAGIAAGLLTEIDLTTLQQNLVAFVRSVEDGTASQAAS